CRSGSGRREPWWVAFARSSVTSWLERSHHGWLDVGRSADRATRLELRIGGLAHVQYLEPEDHFAAAERIVAVDRERPVLDPRHDEGARAPALAFHQDGSADLPVRLGHVVEAVGEDERLVSRAEDAIAVDGYLDHLAAAPAGELLVNGRREDLVVSVNVAEREFHAGQHLPRLAIDHLVGELDELAVGDGVAHVQWPCDAQKI